MYAFVINHFGSNIKYLEYEIYTILMLKSICEYDIVYMYSKIDTPEVFVNVISNLQVKTVGYDDSYIVEKSKKYYSVYTHFNLLRTATFIFAHMLSEYEKVCVVESDIVISKGFENIFKLKIPAAHIYMFDSNISDKKNFTNYKEKIDHDKYVKKCDVSPINGGIMLFKPEPKFLTTYKKYLDYIIEHNCYWANELLFILMYNETIYNIPLNYNVIKYEGKFEGIKILGLHFATDKYKQLDYIKDNYVFKVKQPAIKNKLIYFKKNFYDKHHKIIDKIIEKTNEIISKNKK